MKPITVTTTVKAPMEKVWDYWTDPAHIMKWAFASDEWEAPAATNDLREGGKFSTTMAAKDKSASFEFGGTYDAVKKHALIEYTLGDSRHVKITFEQTPEGVKVVETFDPEGTNPEEMQRGGWQAILNNFKKHVESN